MWERLSAELGHQPHPLTPVQVEKCSAVLRRAGILTTTQEAPGRRSDLRTHVAGIAGRPHGSKSGARSAYESQRDT